MRYIAISLCVLFLIGCSTQPEDQGEEINLVTDVASARELINSDAEKITISKDVWKELVSEEEFHILFEAGTERPFTGDLLDNKEEGIYVTAGCKQPVFSSAAKFDSGTGWPSFYEPISEDAIILKADYKLGVKRWEILSSRCEEHLGHVFNDGPEPTGLRYCINSAALDFVAS